MKEKIIDFSQYLEMREAVAITRENNIIILSTNRPKRKLTIYLNIEEEKPKKKFFWQRIKDIESVKKITKEEGKEIIFNNIRRIGCKEEIWGEIEAEIMNSKNFAYSILIGDLQDPKSPITYSASYIFHFIE